MNIFILINFLLRTNTGTFLNSGVQKESFLKLIGSGLQKEPKDIAIDNHEDLLGKGVVNIQHEGIIAYCTPLDFSVVDFHCFVCSQNPDNQWKLVDVVQEDIL
ncbi:hypothetical protein [Ohtaekwangia sp.]|uniref:hypothetical protein n=1 Tax=Ohtaekwangia sp. TaxID=2066019 RepID=UPI002FDCBCE4